MLSEMKITNYWRVTDILLAIDISETQYRTECSFYQIMKSEMKGSGQRQKSKITES